MKCAFLRRLFKHVHIAILPVGHGKTYLSSKNDVLFDVHTLYDNGDVLLITFRKEAVRTNKWNEYSEHYTALLLQGQKKQSDQLKSKIILTHSIDDAKSLALKIIFAFYLPLKIVETMLKKISSLKWQ